MRGTEVLTPQLIFSVAAHTNVNSKVCSYSVVVEQLMNDEVGQQAEAIERLAKSITTPTLVLWGDSDKVSNGGKGDQKQCHHGDQGERGWVGESMESTIPPLVAGYSSSARQPEMRPVLGHVNKIHCFSSFCLQKFGEGGVFIFRGQRSMRLF